MSLRSTIKLLALGAAAFASSPSAKAQVSCWAPGMSAPINLTGNDAPKTVQITNPVTLGKPYRYDIYGVTGRIELGNNAAGAVYYDGKFRAVNRFGPVVSSTAFVKLQTSLLGVYPNYIGVTGTAPGNPAGIVESYGPKWTLADPKHPASVYLTFHSASSGILGGLIPGLLAPAYYNVNPTGYFYVLGVCHWAPPPVTGTLTLSSAEVLSGYPINVGYTINREDTDVYRPPLLAATLGTVNVTLLGTPPSSGSAPEVGTAPTPNSGAALAINVDIDLSASSGLGWSRVP